MKYWIHHGLLTINGQKMAKSLGNFITLDEVFKKYSSDVLKLFFLQSHYSSPLEIPLLQNVRAAVANGSVVMGETS